MKTLFSKLLFSFVLIILLIIVSGMTSFFLVYSRSYDNQIVTDNEKQSKYIAASLYSFLNVAYKVVEEYSFNNDVISLETERQTPLFESAIERNDYFELIYAQEIGGMQTGRSSGTRGDRKQRPWFIHMEQIRRPFISDSYYSVTTNAPCTSIFHPIWNGSELIGIMGGDIKLSVLHDMVMETAEEDSWSFILDGKGVVVAHPDRAYQEELYNYARLTKTVAKKDAFGNALLNEVGNIITEEQPLSISVAYRAAIADMMLGNSGSAKFKEDGKLIYLDYRPVLLDGDSDPWYVLSIKDGNEAILKRNMVIFIIGGSMLLVILAALPIVFYIAKNISSPIKIVHSALQKIKEGDLTSQVLVHSKDEIGEMMRLLNQTQDGIGSLVLTIKEQAASLLSIGTELSAAAEKSSSMVYAITANTGDMKALAGSQASSTLETNAAIQEIIAGIENLDIHIESQAQSIQRSSSAIEEMIRNITLVSQSLQQNEQDVKILAEASEKGRNGLNDVSQDILEVAKASEGLLEFNAMIENIASQTNLLSMNAAIEAAHAGEAGKGFAVVASEIRKLAELSSAQAKNVNDTLLKMKSSLDRIEKSAGMMSGYFQDIDKAMQTVSAQEKNIRHTMEKQEMESRSLGEITETLQSITKNVSEESAQMLQESKKISESGNTLESLTARVLDGITDVTSSVEQINGEVNRMQDISQQNKKNIDVLVDKMAAFRIG